MNFIFDFDGTLVDSYASIIGRVLTTNEVFKLNYSRDELYKEIIQTSLDSYIKSLREKAGLDPLVYVEQYRKSEENLDAIVLITKVKETLEELFNKGNKLFIYTHRGNSLYYLLDKLDISKYFIESVNKSYELARKPNGAGLEFLIDKYLLSKEKTYYVGDRILDMQCAKNAGVKGILFDTSGVEPLEKPMICIKEFDALLKFMED